MNINKEELACNLLEIEYVRSRGRKATYDITLNYDLFPNDWFDNESFEAKIEILKEAIENKSLIAETEKYKEVFNDIVL